jgi:hypothetical protein
MLEATEYVPFDYESPALGKDLLLVHLSRLAQAKAARDELTTALLLVAGLLLIGLIVLSAQEGR